MKKSGFVLMELIIVFMVIRLLAAIIIPMLLQAKTRAKHACVLTEFNTLEQSVELYRADYNSLPDGWARLQKSEHIQYAWHDPFTEK